MEEGRPGGLPHAPCEGVTRRREWCVRSRKGFFSSLWDAKFAADAGVSELRVKGEDGSFRAFYYVASARGVLVFHAFVKKTQRTPPLEIELARRRLKELLDA